MKMRSAWFSALVGLMLCTSAWGADGSSGCGPAWYVFKENSLVSSSLRSITNSILWPSSTLGMTLGTSNCAKHKIVEQEKAGVHFATMAGQELLLEMAQGQGEHLTAFAHTLGCDAHAAAAVSEALQRNFEAVAPTSDVSPEALVGNALGVIHSDKRLSAQCSIGLS